MRPGVCDVLVTAFLLLVSIEYVRCVRGIGSRDETKSSKKVLTLGVILPHTTFGIRIRAYNRKLASTIDDLKKNRFPVLNFTSVFDIDRPEVVPMQLTPSPTDILYALCERFLSKNVSAILYITNTELYGIKTASAQYFLQLAGYLGIPVICWNADNSGLETKTYKSLTLQLAPSIDHQSKAMLSILKRYSWHQFSIVTSQIAGHTNFIEAVRDNLQTPDFRFVLLSIISLDTNNFEMMQNKLSRLRNTDTRIILLYATRDEAINIVSAARGLGLMQRDYVWIATQSIIGNTPETPPANFPSGMLGVHFDTGEDGLQNQIEKGVKVFGHGLELYVNSPHLTRNVSVQPNLSCSGKGASQWLSGEVFYNFLRNVSISVGGSKPNLEFNIDGTIKYAELEVMNLNLHHRWEKIGTWAKDGLDIKDIVWPGNSHVPPPGVPEKFHLKVMFLEEPPFIHLSPPDPVNGQCVNRGVPCRVASEADMAKVNKTMASRNESYFQCCSGFCIDLLQKFATDLGFTYELSRVEDGVWGTETNGVWNGLIAALINRKTEVVFTALNINSYREAVIDFTVPFMETGISVVVAKRTGIVSPKAFLEPFDTMSWLLLLVVSIQVATFAIFLFEWCSPSGYNMKIQPPRDHKFSLFRTYWMVWAILFGAAVNVDCPRGYTARFMSNMWALFAVVFLAIYTANLAAFMITREEFYELSGIDDKLLLNPYSVKPPFRFGTIPYSNTEVIMQKSFPEMYGWMKKFNRRTVQEGVSDIKKGKLEAFVYDATVLDYLVSQDDECKLLTVGGWYSMTGYGIAFPRNSKYLDSFNKYMMIYRENGDLERLQRFWMAGACNPYKQERTSSKPLSWNQFMSAFILLACGILLAFILLALEYIYIKYVRKHLAKRDTGGCCSLLSLSMGKSLTFRGAVFEAHDIVKHHRCQDPICDSHLVKVTRDLDLARIKIKHLERELKLRGNSPQKRSPYHVGLGSNYVFKARDWEENHVISVESMDPPIYCGRKQQPQHHHGYRCSPVPIEITEIETVL
uniref:Glutamate receptor ionotropic, NMDA 2B n=1 Tax=Strigamia maritima TaxID=126957 RepID=T1JBL9_STRMM